MSIWDYEDPEIESHQEQTSTQQQIYTLNFCKYEVLTIKILTRYSQAEDASTASLRIEPTTFVSVDSLGYHYGTSVLCFCTL